MVVDGVSRATFLLILYGPAGKQLQLQCSSTAITLSMLAGWLGMSALSAALELHRRCTFLRRQLHQQDQSLWEVVAEQLRRFKRKVVPAFKLAANRFGGSGI
jgi:hypothetical protein